MFSERDYYRELESHLRERDWKDIQIINLMQRIGRSTMLSCEAVLGVLMYQQSIDEQIEAEKEHDRWSISKEFYPTSQEKWDVT